MQAAMDAMREQVGALQAQLDELRERGPGMREQTRCPGCGCRKILQVTEIPDGDAGGFSPAAIATKRTWAGLAETTRGTLHAYVCTACGFVEWHVPDLTGVDIDGVKVRLIDAEVGTDPQGPYR